MKLPRIHLILILSISLVGCKTYHKLKYKAYMTDAYSMGFLESKMNKLLSEKRDFEVDGSWIQFSTENDTSKINLDCVKDISWTMGQMYFTPFDSLYSSSACFVNLMKLENLNVHYLQLEEYRSKSEIKKSMKYLRTIDYIRGKHEKNKN